MYVMKFSYPTTITITNGNNDDDDDDKILSSVGNSLQVNIGDRSIFLTNTKNMLV